MGRGVRKQKREHLLRDPLVIDTVRGADVSVWFDRFIVKSKMFDNDKKFTILDVVFKVPNK